LPQLYVFQHHCEPRRCTYPPEINIILEYTKKLDYYLNQEHLFIIRKRTRFFILYRIAEVSSPRADRPIRSSKFFLFEFFRQMEEGKAEKEKNIHFQSPFNFSQLFKFLYLL